MPGSVSDWCTEVKMGDFEHDVWFAQSYLAADLGSKCEEKAVSDYINV